MTAVEICTRHIFVRPKRNAPRSKTIQPSCPPVAENSRGGAPFDQPTRVSLACCCIIASAANRGTMLSLLMRALLFSCLMWPLGTCCMATPPSNTAPRSFLAENINRRDFGGRRRTTRNGSSDPHRAGLLIARALCVRGGDAGQALGGRRKKWWTGGNRNVNRKPLPAPEALSRCGSYGLLTTQAVSSPFILTVETADTNQCQGA